MTKGAPQGAPFRFSKKLAAEKTNPRSRKRDRGMTDLKLWPV